MPFEIQIDDGETTSTRRVAKGPLVIGRSRSADIRVRSDGVSAHHASVGQIGSVVEVIDLESKNGIDVRGARVPRAILGPGEAFTLGNARVTVLGVTIPKSARGPVDYLGLSHGASATTATTATAVRAPARPRARPTEPAAAAVPAAAVVAHATGCLRASRFHDDDVDFDRLVYRALRSAPWTLVSVVLHALVFAILAFVDLGLGGAPPPAEEVVVALNAGATMDALDERIDAAITPDLAEDLEQPLPDLEDAPFTVEAMPTTEDEESLEDPFLMPTQLDAIAAGSPSEGNTSIGLLPTSIGGVSMGSSFGKEQAGDANAAASNALRASPFARKLLRGLKLRTSRVTVRVLGGDYDQCESVLGTLGLEHDVLLPDELTLARPGREIKAIFYNCTPRPLTETALDHLEEWVREGGYLFTTDWGIEYVLDKRFAQYVRSLKRRGRWVMTDDETIDISVVGEHPLLRGLPDSQRTSRWWLENSSILIDIVDPKRVDVLMESDTLESRHGSKTVAVTFQHGRGRVVHVLGHVFQQEGNLRGTVAMQRLLMNFLYRSHRTR